MKTINKLAYHQLLGLFLLHERAEAERFAIEKAVAGIVGEKTSDGWYHGHVSDCLMNKSPVDDMLRKLDIEVEAETGGE